MMGIVFGGIFAAGAICLIFYDPDLPTIYAFNTMVFSAGGFISSCGIVFGLIFYRCAGCHGLLNFRGLPRNCCPHCGYKLN